MEKRGKTFYEKLCTVGEDGKKIKEKKKYHTEHKLSQNQKAVWIGDCILRYGKM